MSTLKEFWECDTCKKGWRSEESADACCWCDVCDKEIRGFCYECSSRKQREARGQWEIVEPDDNMVFDWGRDRWFADFQDCLDHYHDDGEEPTDAISPSTHGKAATRYFLDDIREGWYEHFDDANDTDCDVSEELGKECDALYAKLVEAAPDCYTIRHRYRLNEATP